jgi:hypothetical protein
MNNTTAYTGHDCMVSIGLLNPNDYWLDVQYMDQFIHQPAVQ